MALAPGLSFQAAAMFIPMVATAIQVDTNQIQYHDLDSLCKSLPSEAVLRNWLIDYAVDNLIFVAGEIAEARICFCRVTKETKKS